MRSESCVGVIWGAMEVKRRLRVECEPRSLVAIDATKRHLVTTIEDGKVLRWSAVKGNYEILRGHLRKATCVVFSPRSDLLCSGSYDHTLRLWNMDGCECMVTLEGHEDEVVRQSARGRARARKNAALALAAARICVCI